MVQGPDHNFSKTSSKAVLPTSFLFRTLMRLEAMKTNPKLANNVQNNYKPEIEVPIELAFAQEAKKILALVEAASVRFNPARDRNQFFFQETYPSIIQILENSESLRGRITQQPAEFAESIAQKLFSLAYLGYIADRNSIPNAPKNIDELGTRLMACVGKMSNVNAASIERSKSAVKEILELFISQIDPIDLLRDTRCFKAYETDSYTFEPSATVTGVLNDYHRTRQFIYAIREAVLELEARFPTGKIRIADLGSGALGLLGIAAMYFSERVEVDFVETNSQSVRLLQGLIKKLNLEKRAKVINADAIKWVPDQPLHGVISETIAPEKVTVTLTQVPLDRITKDLKFTPSAVSTSFHQGDPVFNTDNPISKFEFHALSTDAECVRFEFPYESLAGLGQCIFVLGTEVKVYGNYTVRDNESIMTTQRPLAKGNVTDKTKRKPVVLNFSPEYQGKKIVIEYPFCKVDLDTKCWFG